MQAATIGNSGDILVLNMGEPVKIVDLARAMITLSGATPDEDIQVKFTGLREGEKLTEELFIEEEGLKTSAHEKILIARSVEYDWRRITDELRRLEAAAASYDRNAIKALLREIIPDYQPSAAGVDR
jgi:FlaA1/EpsC-like NDP-sugar epimerase